MLERIANESSSEAVIQRATELISKRKLGYFLRANCNRCKSNFDLISDEMPKICPICGEKLNYREGE